MSDLKPCPFCGKYPQTVVDDATEEKFGVKCFNCGGMIDAEKDTLQEAIEAWNKRVPEEQPKKVKWIKKMKVTETDAYTSYDPEWYCPKCGTKYDPIFAQRVKFCCVCGVGIMGEQETPISRRFLKKGREEKGCD